MLQFEVSEPWKPDGDLVRLSRQRLKGEGDARVGEGGRVRPASGGGGPECTASGVARETCWPGDLAFPRISAPARPPQRQRRRSGPDNWHRLVGPTGCRAGLVPGHVGPTCRGFSEPWKPDGDLVWLSRQRQREDKEEEGEVVPDNWHRLVGPTGCRAARNPERRKVIQPLGGYPP